MEISTGGLFTEVALASVNVGEWKVCRLLRSAIGRRSRAHHLEIFCGTDFIKKRLESLKHLRIDRGKSARTGLSPVTLFHKPWDVAKSVQQNSLKKVLNPRLQ